MTLKYKSVTLMIVQIFLDELSLIVFVNGFTLPNMLSSITEVKQYVTRSIDERFGRERFSFPRIILPQHTQKSISTFLT